MVEEKNLQNSEGPTLEEIKSGKSVDSDSATSRKRLGGTFDEHEYDQKVLDIARVVRVTKGGKRFTFRAAIIIGSRRGKVGFGMGKGSDVAQSVEKAFRQAKKNLIDVVFKENTIPHQVEAKVSSAVVLLKPAPKGSGVKAGGPMRVIAKLAGIEDVSGKIISKTNNKINIAKATIEALRKLKYANPRNKTNN